MAYTTASAILAKTSADMLAEVLTPRSFADFDENALAAVINSNSIDDFSAIRVDAANAVVVIINTMIATVDDEINIQLSKQYTLPIATSTAVSDIASDMCLYRLLGDSGSDYIRDRNRQAIALLSQIAKGDVKLFSDDTQQGVGEVQAVGGSTTSITDHY